MFAGFLFLLLLTGGSTNNNSKDDNNNDGSSWNTTERPELQEELEPNHSFEASGETINDLEPQSHPGQPSIKRGPCDLDHEKSRFIYRDVLECLNLTENKGLHSTVRPAKNHKKPTWVYVRLSILSILDLRENDQTFVSFVGIRMKWEDPDIYWRPVNFDGIKRMLVSADLLWKPDVMIKEMIEKDKAVPTPFVTIHSNGWVQHVRDLTVVSMCKLHVYKFPFDIQSCTLSFKSIAYPEEELKFADFSARNLLKYTHKSLIPDSEWLFLNITVQHHSVLHLFQNQSILIYTITMQRGSALYIFNFLVPILFFFCLDLASFLMSDSGGEKVSFKVTVLLAVTVMQLILKDILPSSSDRIPLIVLYCIGIFVLMMINLLETILVMYLIEKDKQGNYDGDVKKWTRCAWVCNVSDEPPSELLSVAKEEKRSQLMEESNSLEKLPDELSEAVKALSLLLSRKEERKPDYWTRLARKLDNIFFVVYVTVSALFLVVIFSLWMEEEL